MPSRTEIAIRRVIADVLPLLTEAGFRRSRRRFTRSIEPGVVQVVEFEAGRYPPPGMGWGEYGRFTINLGVWVDELRRADITAEDGSTVGVAECHIQAQIGDLLRPSVDTWWEMFESTTAGSEARDALLRFGLPWLDGLRTRADILQAGDMGSGYSSHLLGLSTLDLARLYFAHDDRNSAAGLIAKYLAEDLHPVHRRSL
ncbi:MAG TPA: DUF4304 domain-containing protein, partial [Acidimicrobiales bacterium]